MPSPFQVIREEWRGRSLELARWADERLVNRRDVWGQYTTLSAREKETSKKTYKALTLPQKSMRGQDMVTLEKLQRHFSGTRRNHLIGLHCSCENNYSKWMSIDIDLHDPGAVTADDTARRNEAAAIAWWEALCAKGYDPLLLQSNGKGGFHLWVLFDQPAPTEHVYALAQDVISNWQQLNLDSAPETYPKSPHRTGNKLGAWLRLPGLHHTFDFFTTAWSGEPWLDQPWVKGGAVMDLLIQNQPGPPPPIPDASGGPVKKVKHANLSGTKVGSKNSGSGFGAERATICVDFDGVLASYDGWAGAETIGEPIDGSLAFMEQLVDEYAVTLYSSRASTAKGAKAITAWLEEHGFPACELFTGKGKPKASAYVDDRAVNCRPQVDGPKGYEKTTRALKKLLAN